MIYGDTNIQTLSLVSCQVLTVTTLVRFGFRAFVLVVEIGICRQEKNSIRASLVFIKEISRKSY